MTGRVLIVEDIPENRSTYEIALSTDGHIVDVAQSKTEALLLIRRRSYHVALVDLRLVENDESNMEGLAVLEALHASGEGTALLVLSGHGTPQSVVKAYEKYSIRRYFMKEDADASLEAIRRAVSDAVRSSDLAELGRWQSLSQLLTGGGNDQLIWEGRCLGALDPGGIAGLYGLLTGLLGESLPVLPRREGDTAKIRKAEHVLELSLWSKSRGVAIYGEMRRDLSSSTPNPRLGVRLKTFEKHGVKCSLWEAPNDLREDFVESIWR